MINENYKITLKKEMNYLTLLQELLGFFLVANDETRRNVNSLIKVKQKIKQKTDRMMERQKCSSTLYKPIQNQNCWKSNLCVFDY